MGLDVQDLSVLFLILFQTMFDGKFFLLFKDFLQIFLLQHLLLVSQRFELDRALIFYASLRFIHFVIRHVIVRSLVLKMVKICRILTRSM